MKGSGRGGIGWEELKVADGVIGGDAPGRGMSWREEKMVERKTLGHEDGWEQVMVIVWETPGHVVNW